MNYLFRVSLFLLLVGMTLAATVQAADIFWVGPTTGGDFNDPLNWSPAPGLNDVYYVNNGAVIDMATDNTLIPTQIRLGSSQIYNGGGTMNISDGDIKFVDYFFAGLYNSGTLNMTGGTLSRVGWNFDGYGNAIYGFAAGYWNTNGEAIGSNVGTVNMSNDAEINLWNTGMWIGYGKSSATTNRGIGVLKMEDTSHINITTSPRQFIAGGNGSLGTVIMKDDTRIDVTQGGGNWFIVGASSGIGTMEMSGNSVLNSRSGEVAFGTDNVNTAGSLTMSGNSYLYASNYLTAGNFSGNGVITLQDNAKIEHRVCSWRTGSGDLIIGSQGAYGVMNVLGGLVRNDQELYLGNGANTSTAILNLKGGVVESTGFYTGNAGVAMINFNGGLMRAMTNNSDFLRNTTSAQLSLNVYDGGAMIDTQSYTLSVNQPLVAPAGEGVLTIPVVNGGSGYTTAPIVKVTSGSGNGATAIAQINAAGQVTGIVVTNPGINYFSSDVLKVELFSSNGSGAVLGTPTFTSGGQVSGGLTKTGAGILRLTASNTYTGPTVVSEGTLRLIDVASLASSSITVKKDAVFGGTAYYSIPPVTVESGGMIAPGDGATYGTLQLGTLSLADQARMAFRYDITTFGSFDLLKLSAAPTVASGNAIVDFIPNTTSPAIVLTDPVEVMEWPTLAGETAPNLKPGVDSIGASAMSLAYDTTSVPGTSKINVVFTELSATNYWQGGTTDWSTASNWVGDVPDSDNERALFLASSFGSINLDASLPSGFKVSSVLFDNLNSNTISSNAGKSLVLDSSIAAETQISVLSGNHVIEAPVVMNKNTRMNVFDTGGATGYSLTINGAVSGTGSGLGLFGGGKLTLGNTANTYTGATVMYGGTLEFASIANGGAASSLGMSSSDPANLVLNGTFKYLGSTDVTTDRGFTTAGAVNFDTGAQSLTFSGEIKTTANGLFNKLGSGTLKFTNPGYNLMNGSDFRVRQGTAIFDGGPNSSYVLNSDTGTQSAWWVAGDDATVAGDNPVLEFRSGSFDVVGKTYVGMGGTDGVTSKLIMSGDSKLRTGLISLGWQSGTDISVFNSKPVLEMHDNAFISCSSEVWIGDNNGADATFIMDGNSQMEVAATFRTAANGSLSTAKWTKADMRMSGNSQLTVNAGHLYFGVRGNSVATLEGNARVLVTPSFRYAQASPPNSNDYTIYNTVVGYGNTSGDDMAGTSRLYVKDNAYLQTAQLYVGLYGTSTGAVFQSGGKVFGINGVSAPTYASGTLELGWIIGGYNGLGFTTTTSNTAYGYYNLSGGMADANIGQIYVGLAGTGVVDMTGGTMQTTARLWMGLVDTGYGVFNLSGGELKTKVPNDYGATSTGSSVLGGHSLASKAGGTAIMNLSGTGVFDEGYRLYIGYSNGTAASGGVGILNLGGIGTGGGTLKAHYVQRPNPTLTTTAGIINFHGGNLVAQRSTTTFQTGTTNFVWNEGANIDTNGFNVTISSNMLTPAGASGTVGVQTIAITDGGSGYIAPPAVKITGGSAALGQGATANAVVDLDPESLTYGKVTSIVITNPGVGYLPGDTLTIELKGGISNLPGESVAATVGAVSFNSGNVSGALNKLGLGSLTLSGTNTYTGATNVTAGALRANDGTGLPNASFLNLDGGMLENASAVTFSRTIGTSGAGMVKLNNAGFAAGSGAFTVSLVPSGGGTDLLWGTDMTGIFKLSSPTATNVVTLTNGIRLNGNQILQVDDNTASSADWAVISGAIVDGTAPSGLQKTGAGTLVLTGANTYSGSAGTVVSGGALQADDGVGLPSGSFLTLDGGVLQSNSAVVFTRGLAASGANSFQMTANGGGFSAGAGAMNVRIGGNANAVNWGVANGLNGTLVLSSVSATDVTTFENAINLGAASRTIQVDDNTGSTVDKAVISGAIHGTGVGIIKTGTGILALTGANNYTGTTTLSAGTLDFSGAPSMPGGGYVVEAGTLNIGALNPAVAGLQIVSGTISGTGTMTSSTSYDVQGGTIGVVLGGGASVGLNKTTTATAILTANNTFGGTTAISAGTLQLGAGGALTGPTSIGAAGTLAVNRSDTVTVSNVSGTGTFSNTGAGTTTVTNSTFSGDLNVTAGTVDYSSGTNTLPSGKYVVSGTELNIGALSRTIETLKLTGGTINGSGTLTVNNNQFDLQNGTVNAKLAGNGIVEKASAGTVILNGVNSYTGMTSVYAGALQADNGAGLPSGNYLRLIGGVLQSNNATSFTRVLGTSGSTFQTINGGFAAGAVPLTVNLGGVGATVPFGINIGAQINGLLKFGSASAQNVVTFQNGLELNGASRTIQVDDNAATVADYAVISGVIQNSDPVVTDAGVTKTGTGTLALTGTNTFFGTLSANAGAVRALEGVGLPTSSLLSLNGGVLESIGNVTFGRYLNGVSTGFQWNTGGGGFSAGTGTMTVNIPTFGSPLEWSTTVGSAIVGTLKFGSVTAGNVTTFQNSINLNANRTVQADDNIWTDADYAVITGVIANGTATSGLTKTGAGTLALTGANSYTGTTTISAGALQAVSGAGLPTSSLLSLNGGVLESIGNVTLTRVCGTAAGNVQWTTSGGGFAAGTGTMTVNLGSGAALKWGTATAANTIVGTLKFGSATAANLTTLQNKVSLENAARTIQVDDNPFKTTDLAEMSGVISSTGTSGSLTKTGLGTLVLSGINTYTGSTTISAGTFALATTGQIANSSSLLNNANFVVQDGIHTVPMISGTGTTQVLGTSSLTAPSIVQDTLIIGGTGVAVAAVPEPGTLVLLALAGAGILLAAWRRK